MRMIANKALKQLDQRLSQKKLSILLENHGTSGHTKPNNIEASGYGHIQGQKKKLLIQKGILMCTTTGRLPKILHVCFSAEILHLKTNIYLYE